jgi:hypothetical protein
MLFAEGAVEAHAGRLHNYDGFAARQPACLIHMQQRGWICSSESGPMQALWHTGAYMGLSYDNAKMQRRGWLRALSLPRVRGQEGRALQALCASGTCARRTLTCQQAAAAAAHGPDGSNADVYTGGFRYVLTVTEDYSKRFHF